MESPVPVEVGSIAAASTVGTVVGTPGLPDSFIDALDTDPNRSANVDMDGGVW